MIELFLDRYAYLAVMTLLAIGVYGMLASSNLAKKLIGMVIFTTAIFLFFIHGSLVSGGTVPIIDPDLGSNPAAYVDPLPHLLILTAIVVGVGVLGVGLALMVRIHQAHGTLDETRIVALLEGREDPGAPAGSAEREGQEASADRAGDDPSDGRGQR
jgi:multicomponent Na+:H+ antiporter subunit C